MRPDTLPCNKKQILAIRVRRLCFSLLIIAALAATAPLNILAQWNVQSSGTNGDIYEVHFADAQNGIAAVWVKPGAAEILRTSDGGFTWNKPFSDINQGMTGARMLDRQNAIVIGGTTNFSRVFKSTDGGNNWDMRVDDASSTPAFWAVDFVGKRDGFVAGGQGYVLSTIDGGSSWSPVASLPGGTHVLDLDFIDLRTGYAVVTPTPNNFWSGAELYRTTDGGASWAKPNEFSLLQQVQAVEFVDENIGYAAGSAGGPTIWITTDGGENWRSVYSKPGSAQTFMDICVTPENPFVLYAVGGNLFDENDPVIVRTEDGGLNWTEENVSANVLLRKVHFPLETEGFACGTDGTILQTSRDAADLPVPQAEVSPTELNFGELDVDDEFSLSLNISSISAAELVVEDISFVEEDAAARGFSLSVDASLPISLPGGNFLRADITFKAPAAGEQTVELLIKTNDADTPEIRIPVSGSGVEVLEPGIVVDQSDIDFGEIEENTNSSRTLNIRAANAAGLELLELEVVGAGFALGDAPGLPVQLNEDPGLDIMLNFEPSAAGEYAAELVIVSEAGEERVNLNGSASETSTGVAMLNAGGEFKVEIGPNPASLSELRTAHISVPRAGTLNIQLVDMRGSVIDLPSIRLNAGAILLPFEIPVFNGASALLRFTFESTQLTVPVITLP